MKTKTIFVKSKPTRVREMHRGEPYEFYPLGKYIVAAPGICGGRPTFKYTRLEVSVILSLIASGESVHQIVRAYSKSHISPDAICEAVRLADRALIHSTRTLRLAA